MQSDIFYKKYIVQNKHTGTVICVTFQIKRLNMYQQLSVTPLGQIQVLC